MAVWQVLALGVSPRYHSLLLIFHLHRDRTERDTYKKQGKGVEWQTHGMESDAIEPALGVLDCLEDVAPGEPLIMRGVRVRGQTIVDEQALSRADEICGVWVVLDEPVCAYGDDNGGDAFEDEDPAPAILPDYAAHMANTLFICRQHMLFIQAQVV